mgnify:CR=1 FL=1
MKLLDDLNSQNIGVKAGRAKFDLAVKGLKKHLSDDIEIQDVTDDYCVFGIFGPKSRMLMEDLSNDDFNNLNFKFANSKYIKIDGTKIIEQAKKIGWSYENIRN